MSAFDDCLSFVLAAEGGYTSNREDSGSWSTGRVGQGRLIGTNHGISAPVLIEWMGPQRAGLVTAAYMMRLSVDAAGAIYGARYWNPVRGDALPAGCALMVLDDAVNCGVRGAAERLQIAAGLGGGNVDGSIGPFTLAAVAKCDPRKLIADLATAQEDHYRQCAGFAEFGKGWLARLDRRETAALNMLAA